MRFDHAFKGVELEDLEARLFELERVSETSGRRAKMSRRNIARRLERLEAELAPPNKPPGVTLIFSSPGVPDEIRQLRFEMPAHRRSRAWPPRRGFKSFN